MTTPYSDTATAFGTDTPARRDGRPVPPPTIARAGLENPAGPGTTAPTGTHPPRGRRDHPGAPARVGTRARPGRASLEGDLRELDPPNPEGNPGASVEEDEGPIVVMAPRPWSPPAAVWPAVLVLMVAGTLMAYRALAVDDWQGLLTEGRNRLLARIDRPDPDRTTPTTDRSGPTTAGEASAPAGVDRATAAAVPEPPALEPPRADLPPSPARVAGAEPTDDAGAEPADDAEAGPTRIAGAAPAGDAEAEPVESVPPLPVLPPVDPAVAAAPDAPTSVAAAPDAPAASVAETGDAPPPPPVPFDATADAKPADGATSAALDDIQKEAERRRAEQEELAKLREKVEAEAPPPRRAAPRLRDQSQQMLALMREMQRRHLEAMDRVLRQMEREQAEWAAQGLNGPGFPGGMPPVPGGLPPGLLAPLDRRHAEALERADRDLQRLRERLGRDAPPGLLPPAGGLGAPIPPPPPGLFAPPGAEIRAFTGPDGTRGFIMRWGTPPPAGGL